MNNNPKDGPLYLSADGRFTRERPRWMPPRGIQAPRLDALLEQLAEPKPTRRLASSYSDVRLPSPKPFKTPVISEEAAKRIAQALHVLLSEPRQTGKKR